MIWEVYWRLTVLREDKYHHYPWWWRAMRWLCICICWNEVSVISKWLRSWNTKTCWCKIGWKKIQKRVLYNCLDCKKEVKQWVERCRSCYTEYYSKEIEKSIWWTFWDYLTLDTNRISNNSRYVNVECIRCKYRTNKRYSDLKDWKIVNCDKCWRWWNKHWNWQWWITDTNVKIRGSKEYYEWRTKCFERDWYKCQISWKKWEWDLVVHHITPLSTILKENWENDNLIYDINNWITLNKKIHEAFHSAYWKVSTYDDWMEFKNNIGSIEVKLDDMSNKTGNFFLEYECNWKKSGVYKQEDVPVKWWAHSDWKALLLISMKFLVRWVSNRVDECNKNKTKTSRWARIIQSWGDWGRVTGLVVPKEELENIAYKTYNL